ncbi:hypothetical protein JHK87_039528 [Glycine soja]|nr:hypothetical protein JHK87_039528 [Glycine soja]
MMSLSKILMATPRPVVTSLASLTMAEVAKPSMRYKCKFLFDYDDPKLWFPEQIPPKSESQTPTATAALDCVSAGKNQHDKICILAIDDGGMREILTGKALTYLEATLKKQSNDQNATITDYFDVAIGTGVGGIFTAMLFSTKTTAA